MPRARTRRILPLALVFAAVAVVAWAFWPAAGDGSGFAASGSITASTISTPSAGFNSITVTWAQQASVQPSSANNSLITYSVERKLGSGSWAAVSSGACSGAKAYGVTSCIDVPAGAGSYSYRTIASYRTWSISSNVGGPVTYGADTTAPTNAITLSSITGGAYKSGATVYYRGAATGSFRLTNAVADSGPAAAASSQTVALTGTSTGWSHSPSTVSTPSGGPFVSAAFSWSAATTSSPAETVTGADTAGNTAATALTFTDDSVAPAGGAVDATGLVGGGARYSTATGLSIAFTAGTDGGSGLATGAQLLRASATLTNGTCGAYGSDTQIGSNDPVSPVANTVPADQTCYRYRYVVPDRVGNSTTYASGDVKVDSTAPAAPTFAFSALTNSYATGSTLYYRGSQASGGFTVTASASEATSGMASYAYPTPPTGWTATTGALGVKNYSWIAINPTAGAQAVTATNDAALTSPSASFTLTSDTTAPTTGTVTFTSGYYNSAVSVSFTAGTDAGSGVGATSGLLQRREATLTGTTCGAYGAYATVTGGSNPTSPFSDASAVNAKCYQYQYGVSDNVGNPATYATSASVAKVETTAPTITRATVAKSTTSTAGTVRQDGAYYVFGQVTDNAVVSTVTANASAFDAGVTATSLTTTGGPWTVGGLSYNYRSAALTADTGLTTGATPSYTVTATDSAANVTGPTSFSALIETYSSVINATAGLVSYWRMGESASAGSVTTAVSDTFTDTTGVLLQNHVGATGATWTRYSTSQSGTDGVITAADRLRRNNTVSTMYYASGVPASPDYSVQADVYVRSLLTNDAVGVIGRASTSADTYYRARYVKTGAATAAWELTKVVAGTSTVLGSYSETLTALSTYALKLDMDGSTIRLLVNGVERVSATDTAITSAGRGGVRLGYASASGAADTPSDTTGLHVDNLTLSVPTPPALADSKGSNTGTYLNGVTLDTPGALAGDANTAALLDGTNDYASVPDSASTDVADGPLTLEGWVKRSNAVTTSMCIIDKGVGAAQFCFDANNLVLLRNGVAYITRSTSTTTDTSWHHVVATKSGATSVVYLDGVNVTGTVTNSTLVSTTTALLFGVVNPSSAGGYLAGAIDEFAFYNTALSAATVLDHYKAGAGTG